MRTLALLVAASTLIPAGCRGYPDPYVPEPRITLRTSVGPGPNNLNCDQNRDDFIRIGDFGDAASGTPPRAVPSKGTESGVDFSAACTVRPENERHLVFASAELIGAEGATVTLSGTASPYGEPSPADGVLSLRGRLDFYQASNCAFDFASEEQAAAPGWIWATITCPQTVPLDATKQLNGMPIVCHSVTTIRAQDCSE